MLYKYCVYLLFFASSATAAAALKTYVSPLASILNLLTDSQPRQIQKNILYALLTFKPGRFYILKSDFRSHNLNYFN